jgi:hypothetical protein
MGALEARATLGIALGFWDRFEDTSFERADPDFLMFSA